VGVDNIKYGLDLVGRGDNPLISETLAIFRLIPDMAPNSFGLTPIYYCPVLHNILYLA